MAKRLLSLQVLRGLAANLVIVAHLCASETKYAGTTLPVFASYGIAGVDIFFVLSGFIMVGVTETSTSAGQFLWRRAIRILPAYWLVSAVVLAVSLIAPAWVNSSAHGPISIWRSFLLVPDNELPLLAVGWTLIYEAYFYLVFAVLLGLRIPIAIGLVGWAISLIILRNVAGDIVTADPIGRVWTSPLTAEFIMGAAAGVMFRRGAMRFGAVAGVVGLTMLVVSIVVISPAISLPDDGRADGLRVILFGIPAALIVYSLAARETILPYAPPGLLVALGDWSYATYLTHVLVLSAIGRVIHATFAPGLISAVILAVLGMIGANLVGAVMFKCFERPVLRFLGQLFLPSAAPIPRHKSASSAP
jgi:peptidoglycan/LPS O-acetylase OafA/YrhL